MKVDQLKPGKFITLIGCSSFMACTTQSEYKIVGNTGTPAVPTSLVVSKVLKSGRTSPKKLLLHLDRVENGEDKRFTLIIVSDKPLTMGSDMKFRGSGFHGNAKLNLGGAPREQIKELVAQNINENFTDYKDVTYWGLERGDEDYSPLYTQEEVTALQSAKTEAVN